MKQGDLVVIMNSGGKLAVLIQPWPRYKEYQGVFGTEKLLLDDGWEIFRIAESRYDIMEEWNLTPHEKI